MKHKGAYDLPGGPAFPVSIHGEGNNSAWGMSLRDYFAGQALAGLITNCVGTDENMAAICYRVADVMLDARQNASEAAQPSQPDRETTMNDLFETASGPLGWHPEGEGWELAWKRPGPLLRAAIAACNGWNDPTTDKDDLDNLMNDLTRATREALDKWPHEIEVEQAATSEWWPDLRALAQWEWK
jgi:hypothetical protein